jgi:hypothetical protein
MYLRFPLEDGVETLEYMAQSMRGKLDLAPDSAIPSSARRSSASSAGPAQRSALFAGTSRPRPTRWAVQECSGMNCGSTGTR